MDSGRPIKDQLNPLVVSDIIECVVRRCDVNASIVRASVTAKCANENTMLKQRQKRVEKQKALKRQVLGDAENHQPLQFEESKYEPDVAIPTKIEQCSKENRN